MRLIPRAIRLEKPAPARVEAAPCKIDVPYHTTGFSPLRIAPADGTNLAPAAWSAAEIPIAKSSLQARHNDRYSMNRLDFATSSWVPLVAVTTGPQIMLDFASPCTTLPIRRNFLYRTITMNLHA